LQYNSYKLALLDGGINHVETNHMHRNQRSERVIGAVLQTLIEKYGYKREEFFITTKQGFIALDSIDEVPPELVIAEMVA
jgi:diketogulonate reductase-like aldo/keto reductase